MALLMNRKIFISCRVSGNAFSNICPSSVRRNASSIRPNDASSLSDASSVSSSRLSKREAVVQRKRSSLRSLLSDHGFTDAHISTLETRIPGMLKYNSETNLSFKLKFLESIGLSKADIPKSVLGTPYLLSSSLEKKLIPCYNYLKNLPLLDDQLDRILKSHPGILTLNFEKTIAPNVELLRGMGIPSSIITYCLTHYNLSICCSHALFKSSVDQAIEMGLNPSSKMFIVAVSVMRGVSEKTWSKKMEVYRGFGMSDAEIFSAFRNNPWIMAISEKKIARGLEFFMKELHWTPANIASTPVVLLLSLEKRVIPRCRVIEILREKGLLEKAPLRFFKISEEEFLNQYIHSYEDVSAELMDVYKRYSSSKRKTL